MSNTGIFPRDLKWQKQLFCCSVKTQFAIMVFLVEYLEKRNILYGGFTLIPEGRQDKQEGKQWWQPVWQPVECERFTICSSSSLPSQPGVSTQTTGAISPAILPKGTERITRSIFIPTLSLLLKRHILSCCKNERNPLRGALKTFTPFVGAQWNVKSRKKWSVNGM